MTLQRSKDVPATPRESLRQRRAREGFTLVELLITLAIAAILLTLGVPSFQDLIANNRLATASNDLLLGLSAAKSEAIRRNASMRFCLNATDLTWKVVTMADAEVRIGSLPSSVAATPANLDTDSVTGHACVRFRADGLSYGTGGALLNNGAITLTLSGKTRTVNVKTGAIYVAS